MDRSCDATRFDKIESATQNCQWIRGFKPEKRFEPFSYPPMDSPNSLGYIPSCPNGISDTLRPLPSEWAYLNVAGKPIPCFRDAVMLKSACRYAFVGISGRSYRPRVFIGFSSLWPRVDAGSNPAEGTHETNPG